MRLETNKTGSALYSRIGLKPLGSALGRMCTLSPADDRISFKKTLCLAIEKGEVSAAFGSRFFSAIKTKGFKKYPFPEPEYPNPDFLATSLALAAAELKAEGCSLTLCLPKAWAVVQTVDFPAVVLENLSQVITVELDRITPFPAEGAYFDYAALKEEAGRVSILVAAVRAELINPYLKAIQEKGFKIDHLAIDLLAMGTLCRFIQKSDQALYIEAGESLSQGISCRAKTALRVFSDSFPSGDETINAERINQGIAFLDTDSVQKERPGPAVFWFKGSNPALKEKLKSCLAMPVQWLEESDLGFDPLGWEKKAIPYAAVGGLLESLWVKSLGLNLLLKGIHKKPKSPVVVSLLLMLLLAALVGLYWMSPLELERKRLDYLDKQIALKKIEVKKVEALKKEIGRVSEELTLIEHFKQSKPLVLNIFKELTVILPRNTWLTRVRLTEPQVQIEGYAPSASALIPRLDDSELFTKVEYAAPTFRDPRLNIDRFQIKMEIENGKK